MLERIQFSTVSEFLAMGGYAFNVWSVYALFTVFVAVNLLMPVYRNKQLIKELKRRYIVNREMNKNSREDDSVENLTDTAGENQ